MSNPRKFSEKIQIQLQKQEEETRRFNEMMQEAQLVKVLYTGQAPHSHHQLGHHPSQPNHQTSHPHPGRGQHLVPSFPPYRGGSLPNVNQMANQAAGIDLQDALESLEMLRTERDPSPRGVRHPSPTPQTGQRRHFSHSKRPTMEYDANRMPHSYLSPPEQHTHLTKRAHSDSALHQSANPHMDGSQQSFMGNFSPNRRSPVPEKLTDPHYVWGDPNKVMHRPKSCEISGLSGYNDQQQQHQQQQQQHLLSPSSNQSPSGHSNATSGSLPDLTNPTMNFPTLVAPVDPEDAQSFTVNNGNQIYMSNHIRTPVSHSSSTSPQNVRRSSGMRGGDSNGPTSQRKSPHPAPVPYETVVNHTGYSPYHAAQIVQSFNTYRSNSSSPGGQDQLGVHNAGSSPSSPGNGPGMPYTQDPHYLDMQQTVQNKFEQITMDHASGNTHLPDPYMTNLFNAFVNSDFMQRNQLNEMGQIPDIIFTGPGMDDQSHLRVDYSNFFPPTSASSSTLVNSHPFHQHPGGAGDPYPNQSLSQDSVDLLDVLKLDQYDLGMLNDVNLGHMVDPETEEQFRLDNNNQ